MKMMTSTRETDGVMIVDISGRILLGQESAALRDLVCDLLRNGHKKILLNLGDVHHIDSSGVGSRKRSKPIAGVGTEDVNENVPAHAGTDGLSRFVLVKAKVIQQGAPLRSMRCVSRIPQKASHDVTISNVCYTRVP